MGNAENLIPSDVGVKSPAYCVLIIPSLPTCQCPCLLQVLVGPNGWHSGCWRNCPHVHPCGESTAHMLLRAFILLISISLHWFQSISVQLMALSVTLQSLRCVLGLINVASDLLACAEERRRARKPAGQAGAFTIFMMPFTRMERGSSEAFWVTGNETGFREICTADTPATEILLSHVRTRKCTFANSTASILTRSPIQCFLFFF